MMDLKRVEATIAKLHDQVAKAHQTAREADINAALKFASAQLDTLFRFRGEKADPDQSLAWPRKGAYDDEGKPVSGVPEKVQDATYILAGYRLLGFSFGSGDQERDRDVLLYLLLLLNGLTDPLQPMKMPNQART